MPSDPCFRDSPPERILRLDVEEYVRYNWNLSLRYLAFMPFLIVIAPCRRQNLRDYAEAVEVGVTKDSLVFCKEKTKTCWRCAPCDSGRMVKEIPLSQITDVKVIEPAGDCCPRESLFRVQIQTAGKSGIEGPELEIMGLSEQDTHSLRAQLKKGRKNQVMKR